MCGGAGGALSIPLREGLRLNSVFILFFAFFGAFRLSFIFTSRALDDIYEANHTNITDKRKKLRVVQYSTVK